jgi:hypothetical protein
MTTLIMRFSCTRAARRQRTIVGNATFVLDLFECAG